MKITITSALDNTLILCGVELVARYGDSLRLGTTKLTKQVKDQLITEMTANDGNYRDGELTVDGITYTWREE